jgi:DNA-binding CsgD family transcriptional regulator
MPKGKLVNGLVTTWPGLPYLSLGVWYAWLQLALGGLVWLSDTEVPNSFDTVNISYMSIPHAISDMWFFSSIATALVMLCVPFVYRRIDFQNRRFVLMAGFIATLGSLLIIISGPYYLSFLAPFQVAPIGMILCGSGIAIVILKCGSLYCGTPPRKALLYCSLSILCSIIIYFLATAPSWTLRTGGPTITSSVAFIGLPILAAYLTSFPIRQGSKQDSVATASVKHLAPAFWKFVVICFALAFIERMFLSMGFASADPAMTLSNNNLRTMMGFIVVIIFAGLAIYADPNRMNFGKLYSLFMLLIVATIALVPILGDVQVQWIPFLALFSDAFLFLLWLLIVFYAYQKRIHSNIVFGLSYGLLSLGGAVGWALGNYLSIKQLSPTATLVASLASACIVLMLVFVLFNERDLDLLYSPASEKELPLQTLLKNDRLDESTTIQKQRFTGIIESLASEHHLSHRETEVLRYLAVGRGGEYIAEQMNVTLSTVRVHTRNIYSKLDIHSRKDLLRIVDRQMKKT